MRRLLVATALVAATLPATAHGSAPRTDAGARVTAWAAEYTRFAKHVPAAKPLADDLVEAANAFAAMPRETETYDLAVLEPAGDLDGDGQGDVADLRVHETYDDTTQAYSVTLRVEARRGRDGKALWSVALPGNFPFPIFDKVGANGRPGMLVLSFDGVEQDLLLGGAVAGGGSVTAYDGRGTQLWTYAGDIAGAGSIAAGAGSGYEVSDLGDLVPGGGVDVLLQTTTSAGAGDPLVTGAGADVQHMQLAVLDGATGTAKSLGTAYETTRSSWASVLGDVSGDRRADAGVVIDGANDAALHVLRSSDGAEVWSAGGFTTNAEKYPFAMPDVTGDGVADVGVGTYGGDGEAVALVDGKAGRVAWTKPASLAVPVGDVDRRRGSELVLVELPDSPDSLELRATAYTGSGKRLWSTVRRLAMPTTGSFMASVYVGGLGDVQADGVTELGYRLTVSTFGESGTGPTRRDEGIVDGRTGRVSRDPVADMKMSYVPLDGRGVDAYVRTVSKGVLTVTAWRGDAPKKLWQTSVAAGGQGDTVQGSFTAYLDRDRCGELAVSVYGSRTTTVVLSGATGAPMWALTRTGSGAGTVTKPKARSVKRFARTC